MEDTKPNYHKLLHSGDLRQRVKQAFERMMACDLCPHRCRVDRLHGAAGKCRTGAWAIVCSFSPHYGEEAPLTGRHGSGTIFFSNCNLECRYCQNFEISQLGEGQ